MATTLDELVIALRGEIGDSTNLAMGVDSLPALRQMLARIQRTYHTDFDWPHMIRHPEEPMLPSSRFYTFNEDTDFLRIFCAWSKDEGGQWIPMAYGVEPEHYNTSDPEAGQGENRPLRWAHYGVNQFEVWPMPLRPGAVKFKCIKKLAPLVAGTDECELDQDLLVLTAAAEMLSRLKSEDAKLKLAMATAHYNRLKGRMQKNRMFVMGQPSTQTGPQPSKIRAPR